VCRRAGESGWSARTGCDAGRSFGFQIGASETEVALLVINDGGMKHLLSDKFTLGGEAAVAAGPLGRDAAAQTVVNCHGNHAGGTCARGARPLGTEMTALITVTTSGISSATAGDIPLTAVVESPLNSLGLNIICWSGRDHHP
jgi:hypothetical protein